MNQWIISLIIGFCVLATVVPGLLYLRFGKKGQELFGNKNSEPIEKVIAKKQKHIKEIQNKINANEKIIEIKNDIFYITKLKDENKLYSKDINRLKREINNLKNNKH